jgi:hypothetical protein
MKYVISILKNSSGQYEARKRTPRIGGEDFCRFNPNESSIRRMISTLKGTKKDCENVKKWLKNDGVKIGEW